MSSCQTNQSREHDAPPGDGFDDDDDGDDEGEDHSFADPTPAALAPSRAVGTLSGNLDVSNRGTVQLTYPIAVTPGRGGIEPSLSLSYAGGSDEHSYVGAGWHLQGLSEIHGCKMNVADDGQVSAISTQVLCLDGQRLKEASPGVYHLVGDARVRVKAEAAGGFVLETGDGGLKWFGGVDNAEFLNSMGDPIRWALRREQDRFGNYLLVDYLDHTALDAQGAPVHGKDYGRPYRIRYTGALGGSEDGPLTPQRTLEFEYEDHPRPHFSYDYARGVARYNDQRLTAIENRGPGGTVVRRYELEHGPPDDGQGIGAHALEHADVYLRSLKMCDGSGTCMPAERFEYEGGAGGLYNYAGAWDGFDAEGFPTNNVPAGVAPFHSATAQAAQGLSGTRTLAYVVEETTSGVEDDNFGSGWIQLGHHTAEGGVLWEAIDLPVVDFLDWPSVRSADLNGDGLVEWVVSGRTATTGATVFYLKDPNVGLWEDFQDAHLLGIADFDGDGLSDLAMCWQWSLSAQGKPYVTFGDPTLYTADAATNAFDLTDQPVARTLSCNDANILDLSGNGRAGFLTPKRNLPCPSCEMPPPGGWWAVNRGESKIQQTKVTELEAPQWWRKFVRSGDFNGDGRIDLIRYDGSGLVADNPPDAGYSGINGCQIDDRPYAANASVYWNTGIGFEQGPTFHQFTRRDARCQVIDQIRIVDLDGDGSQEVVFPNEGGEGHTRVTFGADPSSFVSTPLYREGIAALHLGNPMPGFNGPGTTGFPSVIVHKPPSDAPADEQGLRFEWDLLVAKTGARNLTALTDGLGARVEIVYGESVAIQHGQEPWQSAVDDPNRHPMLGGAKVVAEVRTETPEVGVFKTVAYRFEGGDFDPKRQQILGYARVEQTIRYDDEAPYHLEINEYNRQYDGAHNVFIRPAAIARTISYTRINDTVKTRLTETTNVFDSGNADIAGFHYTYNQQNRLREFELDGLCTFGNCPGESDPAEIDDMGLTPFHTQLLRTKYVDGFGNPMWTTSAETFNGGLVQQERIDITRDYSLTEPWQPGRVQSQATRSIADGKTASKQTTHVYGTIGEVVMVQENQLVDDAEANSTTLETQYILDDYGNVLEAIRTGYSDLWGTTVRGHAFVMDTSEHRFVESAINDLGDETQYVWDTSLGVVTTTVDANNVMDQTRYDGFGRVVRRFTDHGPGTPRMGGGQTFAYLRLSGGAISQPSTLRTETIHGNVPSAVDFDKFGNAVRTEKTALIAGGIAYSEHTYDRAGRASSGTLPHAGTPAGGYQFTYDELDRRTSSTSPDGRVVENLYDENTTTIKVPGNRQWHYKLVQGNKLAKVTDPAGTSVCRSYGPFGFLSRVEVGCGQVADDASVFWDQTYTIEYVKRDAYGRVLQSIDPNRGNELVYYDGLGDLRRKQTSLGTVDYTVDAIGRLVTRVDADGTSTWQWDSNAGGDVTPGLLRSTTSSDGVHQRFGYDSYSRLKREDLEIAAIGVSEYQGIEYDNNGRVAVRELPSVSLIPGTQRERIKYSYSADGALVTVTDDNTSGTYWKATDRDAQGRLTAETYGNGVNGARTFFADGHLDQLTYTNHAAVVLQDYQHDYYDDGNMRSRISLIKGDEQIEDYIYDDLNRLTSATSYRYDDPNGSLRREQIYGRLGNVHVMRVTSPSDVYAKTFTYGGAQPSAPSSWIDSDGATEVFAYDGEGHREVDGLATLTFLTTGQVKTVDGPDFESTHSYDAAGHKVVDYSITNGGDPVHRVSLFGGSFQMVLEAAGLGKELYIGADGGTKVRKSSRHVFVNPDQNEDTEIVSRMDYIHADGRGSTDVVTDSLGAVVHRNGYTPFGQRRDALNWASSVPAPIDATQVNKGFAGNENQLGDLINMGFRFYDPGNAMFISPDPITAPENTQGYNPYAYLQNNPINLIDPTGLMPTQSYTPWFHGDYLGVIPAWVVDNGIELIRRNARTQARAWGWVMRKAGADERLVRFTQGIIMGVAEEMISTIRLGNLHVGEIMGMAKGSLDLLGAIGNVGWQCADSGSLAPLKDAFGQYGEIAIQAYESIMDGSATLDDFEKLGEAYGGLITGVTVGVAMAAFTGPIGVTRTMGTVTNMIRKMQRVVRKVKKRGSAPKGRGGAQPRLRQIADDPNVSSADRGWIRQEMNQIDRGTRKAIRNPPGKELGHSRGREAAKGFDHMDSPSNLQDADLHRLQHRHDNQGRKNRKREER